MLPSFKVLCFNALLIFIGLTAKAQGYFTVTGTVGDEKGAPLPGVTVFITNSKYSTSTDNEGKFSFNAIQPGVYEVVFKMMGYIPLTQNITVTQKSVRIIARLQEDVIALKAITIKGKTDYSSDQKRDRYLSLFIKSFIGETVNAEQCKLLNPEVLNFHYDRNADILTADADELLVIENNALGYKIQYLLTEFVFDYKSNTATIGGSPNFEELKGNELQRKKWEDSRRIAYLSSSRHFFRAVMNNTAKEEGYVVSTFVDRPSDSKLRNMLTSDKPLRIDLMFFKYNENFRAYRADISVVKNTNNKNDNDTLKLSKRYGIYVAYNGVKASPLFFKTGVPLKLKATFGMKDPQESELQLVTDTLMIDKNGEITPSKKIIFNGYWGWERIADLTPLEYFVDPVFVTTPAIQPDNSLGNSPRDAGLKHITTAIDTIRRRRPIEKLYLQTDKPYYNSGDTLRFKAYLLNADFLTPSVRSGLLYVELDDVANKMVKRIMVPVASGISWGDIALVAEDIPEGSYTLRAYTNWMQNFGEDYVFKKNIYISSTTGNITLVGTNFKLLDKDVQTNIHAGLRFTGLNGQTLGLRDMQFRVMNGRRTLFRDKLATNIDGTMDINFDLADKTALKNLSIQAQYRGKGADTTTLIIPITINRPENADLQFMPEGGNLVAGVQSKIGFKAIGEDGKSVEVAGKIYNSKQQPVTELRSTHKGMGSFELTPQAGESYTAVIDLPGKQTKSYPLPVIKSSGTTLKVISKTDSLEIILNTTADAVNNTYYLVGQSRGVVCYAMHPDISKGKYTINVAKSLFPTGIVHFTLLTNTNIPLNERIVYIDHDDNLNISITPDRKSYNLRDSIALAVTVKDKDGKPVEGSFSIAVTDNDQVKADTTGSNMLNNFLFTSDLKGDIEEPGYYFEENTPQRSVELDNLLLTQGWVGYDWKNIFDPKITPQFTAEQEFIVQGKLTKLFNKPLKQTRVTLMQKQPLLAMDTVTDNEGRFVFKGEKLVPMDSSLYLIQAKNKDGENKDFNVGVEVDEFKPPMFTAPQYYPPPWYINTDTTLLNNKNIKIAELKAEAEYKGEGHMLKTVVIKEKKVIPGSHNLMGPGIADYILDEKEMNAAKNQTLFEVLQNKFKNLFYKRFGGYYLMGHYTFLVIDGVFISKLRIPAEVYMESLKASDIKGVEILDDMVFVVTYIPSLMGMYLKTPPRRLPIVLEITTYSGHGAFIKNRPGRYVYKPIPFSFPQEFYRPRYTVKNSTIAMGTDLRSTIHWEPNLVTDTAGRAKVTFFSADKPADYNIIIEGTDMNGNIGRQRKKIRIGAK